ncbi:MAG: hypothetical protein PVG66_08245 [Chromatiales bacterium]
MELNMKSVGWKVVFMITLLLSAIILLSCAGVYHSQTASFEQARQSVLDGLHDGVPLGKDYILRAVPTLATGDAYRLGSVFVHDTYPLRHSNACVFKENNGKASINRTLLISNGSGFDISIQLPDKLAKAIPKVDALSVALSAKRKASFSYEINEAVNVDVVSAKDQLRTKDCWADIANRSVWVLVGKFNAKERYTSDQSLKSNAQVRILDSDALKVTVDNTGNFVVEDKEFSPRIWVFMPYRVDIPGFNQEAAKKLRVAMAEDYLGDFEGPVSGAVLSGEGFDSRLLTTTLNSLH